MHGKIVSHFSPSVDLTHNTSTIILSLQSKSNKLLCLDFFSCLLVPANITNYFGYKNMFYDHCKTNQNLLEYICTCVY